MYKTTQALVLREVKYKEADKILTVLTPQEGKLTVKARGALRKGCKYAAAAQFLTLSEMTLFEHRGYWSINEAETIEQFLGLREALDDLALGTYFAELLETVSDADAPSPAVLQLGLNSLYALSRKLHAPELIKAVFELRLMCLAGFTPEVFRCCVCGAEEPEEPLFSFSGGIHCRHCPMPGQSVALSGEVLAAVRYILLAEPKKIFSFTLGGEALGKLGELAEGYTEAQLDRRFSSLDYWRTVKE